MKQAYTRLQGCYSFSFSKRLAFTAAFAALCAVATLLIAIPLPFGYFNTGDVFVLLAGWCLGPLYGSVAAAVGSALADVIGGFPVYAPATFLIKGAVALFGYLVYAAFKKLIVSKKWDFLSRMISGAIGESFMVLGYFIYEWILYGVAGAISTLLGNALQGVCCLALATAIVSVLYPLKAVQSFFPALVLKAKKEGK